MQKISVTLSLAIIAINFVFHCLSDLNIQKNSMVTNFYNRIIIPNSRNDFIFSFETETF